VVRGLSSTTPENWPAVGESLRTIVEVLAKALPQSTSPPVTQLAVREMDAFEADEKEMDEDADEFLDTFSGFGADDDAGTSSCASDQRRTQFKQFLAKHRYVKVRGKKQHG
jgi:hypothetical protein